MGLAGIYQTTKDSWKSNWVADHHHPLNDKGENIMVAKLKGLPEVLKVPAIKREGTDTLYPVHLSNWRIVGWSGLLAGTSVIEGLLCLGGNGVNVVRDVVNLGRFAFDKFNNGENVKEAAPWKPLGKDAWAVGKAIYCPLGMVLGLIANIPNPKNNYDTINATHRHWHKGKTEYSFKDLWKAPKAVSSEIWNRKAVLVVSPWHQMVSMNRAKVA